MRLPVKERGDTGEVNAKLARRTRGQGLAFNQPDVTPSGRSCVRPGSIPMEGKIRRSSLGVAGEILSAAVVNTDGDGYGPRGQAHPAAGARRVPRRRSLAGSLEAWLERLSKFRRAFWSQLRSSIVRRSVVSRYGLTGA